MQILQFFLLQVERVPAASWVGVLTLVGALIVLWRTNAQHTKRLHLQLRAEEARLSKQLAHATSERRHDRAVDLKRETYFEALGELAVANAIVRAIPGQDNIDDVTRALDPLTRSLTRVALVADQTARDLAKQLSAAFLETLVLALEARRPVASLWVDSQSASDRLALHQKFAEDLMARHMEALEESAREKVEIPKWRVTSYEERFAAAAAKVTERVEERMATAMAHGEAHLVAVRKIVEATNALGPTIAAFEESLRSELRSSSGVL